jgi:hypothetical protein
LNTSGFGIRLNKTPPNIFFKRKDKGGISLINHSENSPLDLDAVKAVCSEYKIHNADINVRGDYVSAPFFLFFVCLLRPQRTVCSSSNVKLFPHHAHHYEIKLLIVCHDCFFFILHRVSTT